MKTYCAQKFGSFGHRLRGRRFVDRTRAGAREAGKVESTSERLNSTGDCAARLREEATGAARGRLLQAR